MNALSKLACLSAAIVPFLAAPAARAAEAEAHWDIQYRYQKIDSSLTINDLTFPDQTHGIACGFITDRKENDRPVVLLTNDGGQTWNDTPIKETCLSLFFLPDAFGWMVTDKGVWASEESGRTWVKMKTAPANLLRIWFLDHQHGFATGRQKHVFETKDAGLTWTPIEAASTAPGDPLYTTYGDITFSGNKGIISGWNIPPRRGGPDWMEPTRANATKQVPHVSILLQTRTGGEKWAESAVSLFGQITRMSLNSRNIGLGLVEFKDEFEYPSEVYRLDTSTGANELSFRAKNRAITDIRLFPDSTLALLVGYETNGPVYRSPVPGKLKVLMSNNQKDWSEIPVDYHAVAHSAVLTGPDDKHVWLATDTGMILKLVQ